ncbi:hypothetical protein C1H46_038023 [Malus baccata]|uniref:Uncharacterized protein n=1 Tax=Malus baccata TaxID=106549 RepID=A0A540KQG4_MALBA|nr:hypothetical protein C1H46_038023 [Malus baccata]
MPLIRSSSPIFIALCLLLFRPPFFLVVIFHPHTILCSDLQSPIRNWISDPLSALTSFPSTSIPNSHKDQVFCGLCHRVSEGDLDLCLFSRFEVWLPPKM